MNKDVLLGLLTVLAVCSCGKENKSQEKPAIDVKVETIYNSKPDGGQGYTGTIEETKGVALSFNTGGTLNQLLVDEGQMVQQGQLIAVVDGQDANNTLQLSEASVKTAQAAYNQAEDAYKRMKMIHDRGSLPDIKWMETLSKLEQARSALEGAKAQARIDNKGYNDTRLYAPFDGYISKKDVEIGQTIAQGLPVVNLVRIDKVKVKISVPESEISNFSIGDSVNVRVEALNGRIYDGHITEKNVCADALSHTYEVKALIDNPHHDLLPGMIAEVMTYKRTMEGQISHTILLPAGIIQLNPDNSTFVWTVNNNKAIKTPVSIGANVGDKIVITKGLNNGDQVITVGQQKVSTGMTVKIQN